MSNIFMRLLWLHSAQLVRFSRFCALEVIMSRSRVYETLICPNANKTGMAAGRVVNYPSV